jgi:hypothetical protein
MTPSDSTQSAQATYNFWLGLIPQFLGQFGGAVPGGAANADPGASSAFPLMNSLMFPADQIAKAAAMTQQSLQALAQSLPPMLQAGGIPSLLAQWATVSPAFASSKPGEAAATAATATQAMLASWAALMSNAAGATPQGSTSPASPGVQTPPFSLQAMTQAWTDMGRQLNGATPAEFDAAFDRTYGALSDAFGLGPSRKLHAAWRDAVAASIAQQDAQGSYALLVQSAFAQGFQRLLTALAQKADAGERIDSVLALLRLWAIKTEEAVHETLQSERGLAATAALTRSALAYRRKMQQVAAVHADVLDMATRRDLDEAYREIQALKRELRGSGPVRSATGVAPKRAAASGAAAAKSKKSKGNPVQNGGADE